MTQCIIGGDATAVAVRGDPLVVGVQPQQRRLSDAGAGVQERGREGGCVCASVCV